MVTVLGVGGRYLALIRPGLRTDWVVCRDCSPGTTVVLMDELDAHNRWHTEADTPGA